MMNQQRIRVKITVPARKYSDVFKQMVVQEYEKGIVNKDEFKKSIELVATHGY